MAYYSKQTETYSSIRMQLIEWGAVMAVICLMFIALFPLRPSIDQPGTMLDMEMMLQKNKPLIYIYILGLIGLFYAYWRIMRMIHNFEEKNQGEEKSLRTWVVGIGALCGIILLCLYPITAIDVGLYVVRARLWTLYDANPMTALPADFPQDLYIASAGEFGKEPSPYGPLWELTAQIPLRLGILDLANGIIAMKFISLLAYLGTAVLIGWHAKQDKGYKVSGATAAAFFALNPFVLLEAIGNGHNDMLALFFLTLGLILWQKEKWIQAAFALTLATLIKVTALILLPLFGIAILLHAQSWKMRITRGLVLAAIFLSLSILFYAAMGPFPQVFDGARQALFDRRGYSPAYAVLVASWRLLPEYSKDIMPAFRNLFILYYLYLLFALLRKKLTFLEAGFMAYFSQLMLGSVFRIWYPLWLIPFAALALNSPNYWRTFLFSITAEFSIISYYVLWRWHLESWKWGKTGPLHEWWDYWRVMTLSTVPWTFGIPLLGGWLARRHKDDLNI